jgi:predicted ester cyclase
MSTQDNKAIVQQFLDEVFNKRNPTFIDSACTPNITDHNLPPGLSGIEGMKLVAGMYLAALPDLHFSFEDLIAEEDKVVVRITISGTQQGELMGIPPSGKSFSVGGIEIYRLSGGKLVEHWLQTDQLSMLQQLGVVAAPQPVS